MRVRQQRIKIAENRKAEQAVAHGAADRAGSENQRRSPRPGERSRYPSLCCEVTHREQNSLQPRPVHRLFKPATSVSEFTCSPNKRESQ